MIKVAEKTYILMILSFLTDRPLGAVLSGSTLFSPAEIQDDLAIASIENVFVYSDRYGHSDLKSD